MNESVAPAPTPPREALKLTGLRPILNARKIERKVMARQIGFDLTRFLNLVGGASRATPSEIEILTNALNVSVEQLLAPDNTPVRRRAERPPPEGHQDTVESDDHAPHDLTLHMTLPDGGKYSVTCNQWPSAETLQRMANALAILAGTSDD